MAALQHGPHHGIEPPEVRADAGKPETATVTLGVREEDEREVVADPDDFRTETDHDFEAVNLHVLHHRLPTLPASGRVRGYCGLYTTNLEDVHPILGPTEIDGFWLPYGPVDDAITPRRESSIYGKGLPSVSSCAKGRLVSHLPVRIEAEDNQAEFSLRGGRDLLPVIVSGLSTWKHPRIWKNRPG